MRRAVFTICALFAVSACNNQPAAPAATPAAAPAAKKLGIRPDGDTEIKPDLSQVPPELQKVYANIDQNIDAHVESLRAHYHRQRDRVAQALQSIDGVTLAEPHGSFFAFAQVDGITDTAAFTEALVRETGLALAPGAGFGDAGEGFVRICFASSDAVVADAMHRLTHYIRQRRG